MGGGRRREGKRRSGGRGSGRLIVVAVLFAVFAAAGLLGLHRLDGGGGGAQGSPVAKALILDPLSTDYPNETLIHGLIDLLRRHGFLVDYYSGANVTVDLVRRLFSSGRYKLIIIRSHGGRLEGPGLPGVAASGIFTGERFDEDRYPGFVSAGLLARGEPTLNPSLQYFVVTSLFIDTYARLPGSLVVVAGCYSLSDEGLARAFLRRGAAAYVGWRGPVGAAENDEALWRLMVDLLDRNMTLGEAVRDAGAVEERALLDAVPLAALDKTVWSLLQLERGPEGG